jgi:hypothetical protein
MSAFLVHICCIASCLEGTTGVFVFMIVFESLLSIKLSSPLSSPEDGQETYIANFSPPSQLGLPFHQNDLPRTPYANARPVVGSGHHCQRALPSEVCPIEQSYQIIFLSLAGLASLI